MNSDKGPKLDSNPENEDVFESKCKEEDDADAVADMPTGLRNKMTQQIIVSVIIIVATIALAFYYRTPQSFLGFAVAAILIYQAIALKIDYRAGRINELCVLCVSVNLTAFKKKTRIVFRTDEETPSYYEFIVPGKHTKSYSPNFPYVIYFNKNNPAILLSSVQL